MFFGPIGKTSPRPLIGWDFFDLFSKAAKWNTPKLISKISNSSKTFVFPGPIRKQRWSPWHLIGWYIFDIFSAPVERNSTKLDRKQDLNIFYHICFRTDRKYRDGRPGLRLAETFSTSSLQPLNKIQQNLIWSKISTLCCVFRADRKTKVAALASDWLRHFRLFPCNRWIAYAETWLEARSQIPLPSLCFLDRSENQDSRIDLWLTETFSTSSLHPLNGIQQNWTGSKISTSSTQFVFFGSIRKQKLPSLIGWGLLDFFSVVTTERKWTKVNRKQDTKVLKSSTKFEFSGPTEKPRWPSWPLIG